MFEQPPKPGAAVPPTQPASQPAAPKPPVPPKADDIFASMDSSSKPAAVRAPESSAAQPVAALPTARTPWLWIALGVVVLAALIGGGIWLTLRSPQEAPISDAIPFAPETTEGAPSPATIEAPSAETPEAPAEEVPAVSAIPADDTDTDRDGLTDVDEVSFGTDASNADTDADGLSDSAEVRVYKTNPLDPDSDDDTYLDGAEVRAGYDPNGPGRLQDIQRALNNQ